MKYKVINSFRDSKDDDKLYKKSTKEKPVFFECDEERFKEIQKKGKFLEAVKEEKKSKKAEEVKE